MLDLFDKQTLYRAKDKEKVFDILSATKNQQKGFFMYLHEIYTFAISLGIKNNKRPALGGKSEGIKIQTFTEDQKKFFDMVVLYDSAGNLDSLDKSLEENVHKMKKTIEEYANGGLEIILDKIEAHPENAYNTLNLLIMKELKTDLPEGIDDDLY